MWSTFRCDPVDVSESSSGYVQERNFPKNRHGWGSYLTDTSWFPVGYGKVGTRVEDGSGTGGTANSYVVVVFAVGSVKRSRMFSLGGNMSRDAAKRGNTYTSHSFLYLCNDNCRVEPSSKNPEFSSGIWHMLAKVRSFRWHLCGLAFVNKAKVTD